MKVGSNQGPSAPAHATKLSESSEAPLRFRSPRGFHVVHAGVVIQHTATVLQKSADEALDALTRNALSPDALRTIATRLAGQAMAPSVIDSIVGELKSWLQSQAFLQPEYRDAGASGQNSGPTLTMTVGQPTPRAPAGGAPAPAPRSHSTPDGGGMAAMVGYHALAPWLDPIGYWSGEAMQWGMYLSNPLGYAAGAAARGAAAARQGRPLDGLGAALIDPRFG